MILLVLNGFKLKIDILFFIYVNMLALPREVWLHIFSFIEKEYAYEDELSCEELAINKEYEGWYYPVYMLYQTSKIFSWLLGYEFTHVDSGVFHCVVCISDINGKSLDSIGTNGRMLINSKKEYVLMGYKIGDKRCEHLTDDAYYHDRYVDDKKYHDNVNCSRWWGDCKGCYNCCQLDAIESQIFTIDPVIKRMVRGGETQEVVIREKTTKLHTLDLKYDASGLELCS